MKHERRQKLIAGTGLLAMLLGALMVLAPGAGATHVDPITVDGNPDCDDYDLSIEAKFDNSGNPGDTGQASNGGLVVNWTFEQDGTISFVVDATSTYQVDAAIVKQGSGANVYLYDPEVASDSGLVDNKGDDQFSHISFCSDGQSTTTTTTTTTTQPTTTTTTTQPTTTTTTTQPTTTTTTTQPTTTTTTTQPTTTTTTTQPTTTTTTTQPTTTTTTEATTTTTQPTTTTTEATTTTTEATTTTTETTPTTEAVDVLDEEVTPTTAAPEVLPQEVTATTVATLPRTGSETRDLAGFGAALLIFGAVLVGGSRRYGMQAV